VINTDRRAILPHRVSNVGRATHELHIMASSSDSLENFCDWTHLTSYDEHCFG
jgi:hypothetical protein